MKIRLCRGVVLFYSKFQVHQKSTHKTVLKRVGGVHLKHKCQVLLRMKEVGSTRRSGVGWGLRWGVPTLITCGMNGAASGSSSLIWYCQYSSWINDLKQRDMITILSTQDRDRGGYNTLHLHWAAIIIEFLQQTPHWLFFVTF